MYLFDFSLQLPITDPTWIFFLVLAIILFAPILLDRLHIPHIIGMILAGVLIGGHGFNILERDSSFELFGKVGLYYIMFLAGLEMDMADFKKNKKKAFIFGLISFTIPTVLGIFSNMTILNYGIVTSILLASMFASHTLVSYPIISRYGLSRQKSVNITVGGTAITVILALFVLVIIAGMFKTEVDQLFWFLLIAKIALACFVIIFFFPRIGRWFFRQYQDNVMQFVFVLAMLFLGAGIMELAGLEGILGAFLVGLVFNRLIPHVSPLMNHVEFVGNALFIPYFLIGVGMIIDVKSFFMEGKAFEVAIVMTLVPLVSKWIAAFITQKLYRMNSNERRIIFGLSSAKVAASLAAVLIGHDIIMNNGERLLNDDVLNGTILMILITTIVSSFVTERASRKIAINNEAQEKVGETKGEENILIPISNPDNIVNLVNLALIIKNPKRKDGLVSLNVVNDDHGSTVKQAQGEKYLEKSAMISAAADVEMHTVSRYDLNIAAGIIHTIKEYNVSDVVIGLHRKINLVDSFWGGTAESLLKGTHRQIMIAKCLMPVNTLRRIIVAVPQKAEYEAGFTKWVNQLCRMGEQLGCRVHFFAHPETLDRLKVLISKKFKGLRSEFSELVDWDDLLLLTGQVNFDHLLVIISARKGSISYDTSFERLPSQLSKYFSNNSLLVVYPDQYGEPQDNVTFSDPRGHNESLNYDKMGQWFYKWFKKN
ncbi:transporter, CPA2 family [Bacteroides luti]|uniref:Transporter, CPA2 family n=1 Tax=Bacteroides luti TaxID=1297750 RepID=A0A1M5A4Z5_9BACE|nr:cation:proton antiporter [Bacteroides luti]SHF25294.1 transporter, CPA2 family [Bacteroides luti]